jgi:DNA-binding response OmpR family regulator
MSRMSRILLVDDDVSIQRAVAPLLRSRGYHVDVVSTGHDAVAAVAAGAPDLVVLDLGLPGLDGLDVTRAIRRDSNLPVIMLTARDDELDKLLGLELGADDYLTKPFSPRELVARVRAVLRRVDAAAAPDATTLIRAGDLTLDLPRMRADLAGRAIDLTPTEFALLAAMARQPGRIFTRSQLLDAVHGVAFESYERAIDTHIKNIRRKLEPDPRRPTHILTVYGVGYRFADERA